MGSGESSLPSSALVSGDCCRKENCILVVLLPGV